MSSVRKKILTLLLFVLISAGQAYPFSVAYSMTSKKTAVCCCAEKQSHCGCSHKKVTKKYKCHEQKTMAYKSLCGGKTQEEILSFRTEPFLTNQSQICVVFFKQAYFERVSFLEEAHQDPPLSPPPRA